MGTMVMPFMPRIVSKRNDGLGAGQRAFRFQRDGGVVGMDSGAGAGAQEGAADQIRVNVQQLLHRDARENCS